MTSEANKHLRFKTQNVISNRKYVYYLHMCILSQNEKNRLASKGFPNLPAKLHFKIIVGSISTPAKKLISVGAWEVHSGNGVV